MERLVSMTDCNELMNPYINENKIAMLPEWAMGKEIKSDLRLYAVYAFIFCKAFAKYASTRS